MRYTPLATFRPIKGAGRMSVTSWWRKRRTAKLRLVYPDLPTGKRAQDNYLAALKRMSEAPSDAGRVRQW